MVIICLQSLDLFQDWLIGLHNISSKSQGLSVLPLCHPLTLGIGPQAYRLVVTALIITIHMATWQEAEASLVHFFLSERKIFLRSPNRLHPVAHWTVSVTCPHRNQSLAGVSESNETRWDQFWVFSWRWCIIWLHNQMKVGSLTKMKGEMAARWGANTLISPVGRHFV